MCLFREETLLGLCTSHCSASPLCTSYWREFAPTTLSEEGRGLCLSSCSSVCWSVYHVCSGRPPCSLHASSASLSLHLCKIAVCSVEEEEGASLPLPTYLAEERRICLSCLGTGMEFCEGMRRMKEEEGRRPLLTSLVFSPEEELLFLPQEERAFWKEKEEGLQMEGRQEAPHLTASLL